MKKTTLKVSDIGEKALIGRIIKKSQNCSNFNYKNSNSYSTAIGDDAALTEVFIDSNTYLVSSSDMLIQSTHFPKEMSYYQMGFKSVAVNISDLIAMGAEPIGFLLNIAVPNDLLLEDFDEILLGVIEACDKYNMPLIGGDINGGPEIIISGTAIGKVEKDKALMKYGFNIGDWVCISGKLGIAALGFELLDDDKRKIATKNDKTLTVISILRSLNPTPRYNTGRILSNFKLNYNISATDITDGLASELYEILNSDRKFNKFLDNGRDYSKGIRLYEDKLPIEDSFKEICKILNLNVLELFFHIGEDFELLFTIPKELKDILKEEMEFYVIGEIIEDNTVEIVLSNGETKEINSKGYEHLS